jgi:hypothetical protein
MNLFCSLVYKKKMNVQLGVSSEGLDRDDYETIAQDD